MWLLCSVLQGRDRETEICSLTKFPVNVLIPKSTFRLGEGTELFKSSKLTAEGTYPNPLEAASQGCDQQFATRGVLGSCGNSSEIAAVAEAPRGAEAAGPEALPVLCGCSLEGEWFCSCQSHSSPVPSSPWLLHRLVPEQIRKISGFGENVKKNPQIAQEAEG